MPMGPLGAASADLVTTLSITFLMYICIGPKVAGRLDNNRLAFDANLSSADSPGGFAASMRAVCTSARLQTMFMP